MARAWRPSRAPGSRGTRERGQQGREIGPGKGEDVAWSSSQQEVARRRRQSGGQRRSTAGGRRGNRAEVHVLEEEEERGGGPGDLFGNSKNVRDPTVKKDFPLM
jgi:hypothetical protein